MTSTGTGVGVALIDIEPVATEPFTWASSVGLRPSHPYGAFPAWPMPINGCDRRAVSLPESLLLLASATAQPSCGRWQLTQAVLPDADNAGSKEQVTAEIDQRLIGDRLRRLAPVYGFHRRRGGTTRLSAR